jgi:hypothetical protein
MTAPAVMPPPSPKILEQLLITGDLSSLSAAERVEYYLKTCESLGLNPTTRPFAYIKLNGKLVLYALRDCSEQLRKLHGVSVENMRHELLPDELYRVTADFIDKTGRRDQASGIVSLKGLSGEPRANKMLGCETKCKRRGTLSICGMGMLDETEVASIPDAEAEAAEKFKPLTPYTPVLFSSPPREDGGGPEEAEVIPDPVEEPPQVSPPPVVTITPGQKRALEAAINEHAPRLGLRPDKLRDYLKENMLDLWKKEHFTDLTRSEYERVFEWLTEWALKYAEPHS